MKRVSTLVLCLTLISCVRIPENIKPVSDFELQRYLGKWFEIARLDHSFERGLSNVTAEYSIRTDGGVKVINRGYSEEDKKWKQAEGKAYFVNQTDIGYLKVSFFGPFYGAYIIFELDHSSYQYSMVSGPDKSYLWILARQPHIDKQTRDILIKKATAAGYETDNLIFVKHE